MQNVRQGILQRNSKPYTGRNQQSEWDQFYQDQNKVNQKQDYLQKVHNHRRVVLDGTQQEQRSLQKVVKGEIDTLLAAKQKSQQDRQNFENQQQRKNDQYQQYLNDRMVRQEQARKEYQKQVSDMNVQLVQRKVETEKYSRVQGYQQDHQNNKENFWKKAQDYR